MLTPVENVDQFLHTILCASPFFCKFQILYYMSKGFSGFKQKLM